MSKEGGGSNRAGQELLWLVPSLSTECLQGGGGACSLELFFWWEEKPSQKFQTGSIPPSHMEGELDQKPACAHACGGHGVVQKP